MSVHICWTEPHEEVFRDDIGERWCFHCRTRRRFKHIRKAPVGMSWYGSYDEIRCSHCNAVDGDCFPGTEREWGEA